MSKPETDSSVNNPEEVKPYLVFEPNEELTGIGIDADGFPLWRLEHLRGIPFPVERVRMSEGAPAAVDIKVSDIAELLQLAGREIEAQWWHGLGLGLTSNPYYDHRTGPTVIFHLSDGPLSEITPDDSDFNQK